MIALNCKSSQWLGTFTRESVDDHIVGDLVLKKMEVVGWAQELGNCLSYCPRSKKWNLLSPRYAWITKTVHVEFYHPAEVPHLIKSIFNDDNSL